MKATVAPPARRPPAARPERGRRRLAAAWLFGGLAAAVLLAGCAYAALDTNLLTVRTVEVHGAADPSGSAVLAAARVPIGTPMVHLDRAAVRERVLAAMPGVATVSVERSWPSTVRLVIHERAPAAAVPQGAGYLLVDAAGVNYRFVTVLPRGTVILRVRNPYTRDAASLAGLAVLSGLPVEIRKVLARVDAPTAEAVSLTLSDKRHIIWGSASDGPAKGAVVKVLLTRPGKSFDVSAPGMATVR